MVLFSSLSFFFFLPLPHFYSNLSTLALSFSPSSLFSPPLSSRLPVITLLVISGDPSSFRDVKFCLKLLRINRKDKKRRKSLFLSLLYGLVLFSFNRFLCLSLSLFLSYTSPTLLLLPYSPPPAFCPCFFLSLFLLTCPWPVFSSPTASPFLPVPLPPPCVLCPWASTFVPASVPLPCSPLLPLPYP